MPLSKTLALEPAQRPAQSLDVVSDNVPAKVAIGTRTVALLAERLRHIYNDCHRQRVVLAGQVDQVSAILGPDVGGIDHGQTAPLEALAGDVAQHLEGVGRGRLIVGIVGH